MIFLNTSLNLKYNLFFVFSFLFIPVFHSQDAAPVVFAEGDQAFCIGNSIPVVTDFTISDADDAGIALFFIQVSSGYQNGSDSLEIVGNNPTINQFWNANEGKLTLSPKIAGTEILFSDLENAVKNVVFTTSTTNEIIERTFSLTIDNANYLPATDHFYEFVSSQGITWRNAKIAAENRTYFGRKGYLATLTSQEEADFAGKQASGAGWIGGSDEETEGVWKWVTGPETGTVFWNGQVNGTTPNYANWNNNEPNDFRNNNPAGEDYAHITDPSIGIRGAWNDLPNEGGTNLYIAKGYVVEYGIPSDLPLSIVATTSIYTPQITTTTETTICESGIATISANSDVGEIIWFDTQTGGTVLSRGTDFTTPTAINTSTTYYATTSVDGCTTLQRTAVIINVIQPPTITNTTNDFICSGTANLSASASAGSVLWYDSLTSTTPIFTGNTYQTPNLTSTTSYFVAASSFNCTSNLRTEVIAEVNATIPVFETEKDVYVLCNNIGSVTLKTINFRGNYTYNWTKDTVAIAENVSEINVSETGIYKVKAISEAGCESLAQTITVRNSEIATLAKEAILIIDDADNNSIQIISENLGLGDYEFALDDKFGIYKDEGFFENISTGMHLLFIRDKNGCGIFAYSFSILAYPSFFTPNGDGKNDYWHIKGFDKDFYTLSDIYIYNRFGVLLYRVTPESLGWDGMYAGKKSPSNSYWFQTLLTDKNGLSVNKSGSFSLIRK
ncbi:T9SS type B sorting domain-containing protein [uncultured Polaribacter sp.]|uniref:Ig-like domain-containing protein n=1 Tax=uncultured Polaribacter sp. TaxID=174711 RepID=UPI0026284861|nr:T9SS type B sorting domain-containing protein [uncultured Polaribacter sp.]